MSEPGGPLEPGERALVEVSAALAAGSPEALERALERAKSTARPVAIEEAILQSYLFLGYPTALNAFARWREISGEEAAPGTPDDRDAPHGRDAWEERGRRICEAVYGEQYDALRENVRRLHPDMDRWMVTEGYGKVLGRPGLELRLRELCVVAMLTVRRVPVQLYSHLRGALRVGARSDEVDEALRVASGYLDDEARAVARSTWERVLDRTEGE